MDPIGSITQITAAVLRRIADAVDAAEASAQTPVTIHIETLVVQEAALSAPTRERIRGLLKGKNA